MPETSLTIDMVRAARKKLDEAEARPHDVFFKGPVLDFLGLKLEVIPPRIVPKIKLSVDCPVGDHFRREFDAWLVEMFGTRDETIIPPGQCLIFWHTVFARPEVAVLIKNLGA